MHTTIAAKRGNSDKSKIFNTPGNNGDVKASTVIPPKTQHNGVLSDASGKDTGTALLNCRAG